MIALPVYLQSQLGWQFVEVSGLLAAWIIFYGIIQTLAPNITGQTKTAHPDRQTLVQWGTILSSLPLLLALALYLNIEPGMTLVLGLLIYGACFAINSSVHSYLIVAFAQREAVSLDVGFYYMANAGGRLAGTLLSGFLYQASGLIACLIFSSVLIILSTLAAQSIPPSN